MTVTDMLSRSPENEISSISTYILTGFRRNEASSSEASLKYFLLGSFATAFFLYGVALMFGATGSTNIDLISQKLQAEPVQLLVFVARLAPKAVPKFGAPPVSRNRREA